MLAGEYAVLKGGSALASTVSCRMRLEFLPTDEDLCLESAWWGETRSPASHPHDPGMRLLCDIIANQELHHGRFIVDQSLHPSMGVGSSSALRLGMALILYALKNEELREPERWDAARLAHDWQNAAQAGVSSGYDIVTQLRGGLVCLQPGAEWPGVVIASRQHQTWLNAFVHPVVSGKGAVTADLAPRMAQYLSNDGHWDTWCEASEKLVSHLSEAITTNQFGDRLITEVATWRDLMATSPARHSMHDDLRKIHDCDKKWTFKTTGAGGDDALLVFAEPLYFRDTLEPQLMKLGLRDPGFRFSTDRAEYQRDG